MPRLGASAALVAVALSAACGARPQLPYQDDPVDLAFELNGVPRRLSELRGRPLVLVLVRTSEVTSEMYLDELAREHARIAGETRLLVLSIAPNEAPFLAPFIEERGLPFPVGLAAWQVAEGTSALGAIPIVPTTYLVDEEGIVRQMIPGAVPAAALERAIALKGWD